MPGGQGGGVAGWQGVTQGRRGVQAGAASRAARRCQGAAAAALQPAAQRQPSTGQPRPSHPAPPRPNQPRPAPCRTLVALEQRSLVGWQQVAPRVHHERAKDEGSGAHDLAQEVEHLRVWGGDDRGVIGERGAGE